MFTKVTVSINNDSCKLKNMTYFVIISGIIGKDAEGKLFLNK